MHTAHRGFTLLELAIAVAIFILAICGIISLFVSLSGFTESAGNITRMINVARGEFETNIRNANFDSLANYSLLPPAIPNNMSLICYVQNYPTNPPIINDVKQVLLVVNYRQRGNYVFGEDKNVNGILDDGEDTDGNGRLSSICEIATFVKREA